MKVVLHPGMPKAGSTTIQTYFRAHEDELRSSGIGYIQPEGVTSGLPAQVISKLDDLLDVDNPTHVVVSHESLIEIGSDTLYPFLDELRSRDVTIEVVIIVRPLGEWAVSKEKQRLRSLKGTASPKRPAVEKWFSTWMAPEAEDRIGSPIRLVDLHAAEGLIPAFMNSAGLPLPDSWPQVTSLAVNRSPVERDLAIYLVLNDAIRWAQEEWPEDERTSNGRHLREIRQFIAEILASGDHHRTPRELGLDEDLRSRLLVHFFDDLEATLSDRLQQQKPEAAERVRKLTQEALTILRAGPRSERYVNARVKSFLAGLATPIAESEARFRTWTVQNHATELAALMLPEPVKKKGGKPMAQVAKEGPAADLRHRPASQKTGSASA
ncbi:MAG: hypothetical protein Q7L55_10275 [Actinomycetota bacterium]|nr:hypothetical protein [Actinomycetota bacterium]